MNRRKTRIVIADDHLVVRMGLETILSLEDDFEVVGRAQNGEEAVKAVTESRANVVIMDLMMPGMNGVEATRRIRAVAPGVKVVVFTSYATSKEVGEALEAGADGALVKDCGDGELVKAIRSVMDGGRVIDAEISRELEKREDLPQLTERQREVITLVSKGFTNADIAERLGVGLDCVKAHMRSIFAVLGASNRAEAVVLAREQRQI